tara:strand:- start:1178 stop:1753 length:576 start_codon:yes stop_codon:yes gene_type:complete
MKIFKIIIFLLITFNEPLKANTDDNLLSVLKEGGKLIFIRHANAPGNGDPDNFNISNCITQRNLDMYGIKQSKNLGHFFLENNIQIDKVLSSEWCRCKDTAKYAFTKYETKTFLNSFFSSKHAHNKLNQIKELKEYIQKWDGKKNLVLITHFVVISDIFNISALSGELIVANKDYRVLIRINVSNYLINNL